MNKKLIIGIIAGLAILSSIFYVATHQQPTLGGASTNASTLSAAALSIGSGCDNSYTTCTGSTVAQLNTGICYIKAYAATIAATTSVAVDCQATAGADHTISALTGVQAGDITNVSLSTTTAGVTYGGLVITGASASTTSGYITIRIENLTGGTFTWPVTGSATGTASYITSR